MTILIAVLYGMALIVGAFLPCYLVYFVVTKLVDWYYKNRNRS